MISGSGAMTGNPSRSSGAAPSELGVDARGIEAFLEVLEAAPDVEPHSVMVLRRGQVIAAGWWAPYSRDRPHLLYSLSKSFTSTALGFAVAEGLVGMDDPVVDYFPEFAADITDERSRAILVRHAASMATGHGAEMLFEARAADPTDIVRGLLLLPPDGEPGRVFAYNQPATYAVAAIVQRVSGQTLTEYLRPRLFEPLGMGVGGWFQEPAGRDIGFSGLHATTESIARLGQLYLDGGRWQGRQVLPREWVTEATRSHVSNDRPGEPPDWRQGYGHQFWMARHGYRGDGAYGQFCIVLPEQDMVIAITAATENMQFVLDAVWEHVLPAIDGPGDVSADRRLGHRLDSLALPAAAASWPSQVDAWADLALTPVAGSDFPSLTGIDIGRAGMSWIVRLHDADTTVTAPLGLGAWAVTERAGAAPPVAVSGAWTDPATLRFDVCFLETPHRLVVTVDRTAETFRCRWLTVPLHGSRLRLLGSP